MQRSCIQGAKANLFDQVGDKRFGFLIIARQEDHAPLSDGFGRITLAGAVFLGVVAIMPWLVNIVLQLLGVATAGYNSGMIISSGGLLIAVGVVLDTMKQLEAQLLMRHYEGFIK